ncbi:hypothetical protein [Acinetobacter baumannii]|uniref:hypothetical protein n=1 Tax=Acinetobacter baumannii TaxID=470 RepID=UPI001DFD031E|nr:hypothetical protein [Acinetobacter baumannii]EHU1535758.1 hypothetical protein [Acinetobacter baumannii]EHU1729952.1 hypothetical protein [Acinetobacter baumannii]EHU2470752.1 hypothetical protein [Acinetobacter baumannii]EHU2482474.1 hypothetical protein [Acinetobacter baumannii]
MGIRIIFLALLVSITSTAHTKSIFIYEPQQASSYEDFINTLTLFTLLKTKQYQISLPLKMPEFNLRHKDKLYQSTLCEWIEIIEEEKGYIKANKKYLKTWENNVQSLTNKQNQLRSEINGTCSS